MKYINLGEDLNEYEAKYWKPNGSWDNYLRADFIFWYDTKTETIYYIKNREDGSKQKPMTKVEWLLFRLKHGV